MNPVIQTAIERVAQRRADTIARDPVQLMRAGGMEPDPWQVRMLRNESPRMLLNCCRQSGKSTTTAALATWTALYQPASLILLLSPSLRQSQELFKKCIAFYRLVGQPVDVETESALRIEFDNGSRILALPGTEGTIRGYSGVRLVILDEAARVPDELYYSVRPMLAVSGGRLLLLSTPFGRRGAFFDEWDHGEGWERIKITAPECSRIKPEFLAEEKKALGSWWFDQEYFCQFRDTVDSVFSHATIMAALSDEMQPLVFPDEPALTEVDEYLV